MLVAGDGWSAVSAGVVGLGLCAGAVGWCEPLEWSHCCVVGTALGCCCARRPRPRPPLPRPRAAVADWLLVSIFCTDIASVLRPESAAEERLEVELASS